MNTAAGAWDRENGGKTAWQGRKGGIRKSRDVFIASHAFLVIPLLSTKLCDKGFSRSIKS